MSRIHEEVDRRTNNNTSIVVSNKKMKFFLLDFVSCYRPSKNPTIQPSSQDEAEDMLRDFTKQLSCAMPEDDGINSNPTASKRKKKPVTRSNSISSSVSQWKPSLTAISEDKVVFVMAKKSSERKTVRSEGKVGAGRTESRAKIRSCDNHQQGDNEYRRNSLPVVIPSFSPTAFLF